MSTEIRPGDRMSGRCDMCGKFSDELACVLHYGYDGFACPKCRKEIQERIKRRYLIAGEHTEPAE